MEPFEVQALGPYTLLAPLAHGGMGSVYFAVRTDQPAPRTLLLVKTLKSSLVGVEDYAGRFHDEARVAVRLRHENLCEVSDAGVDGGTFYLAMEMIEGITLRRMQSLLDANKRRLRPTEAAAISVSLLRGLHAAHIATDDAGRPLGVVHRDVSPHNTMLDVRGRVKVIDYGLATSVLKETFTESAVALGKSGYMPPEQARGDDVTPVGDQYAAAIVFYELLTADRFYGALNSRAIWGVVGSGMHTPRSWDRVPEVFREVLKKALSPRPAERHASCAAFADAIVAIDARAADPEALRGVRELVRSLAPAELEAIEDARATLAHLDDATEKAPRPKPKSAVEATQVVRRTSSSSQSGTSSSPRSGAREDDTASTLLRPRSATESNKRRSRGPLFAAVAGLALSAAAVPVLYGVSAAPPAIAPSVASVVGGTVVSASLGAPTAAAVPAVPAVPVSSLGAGQPVATPTPDVAPPVTAAASTPARAAPLPAATPAVDVAHKRERLAMRADALLAKIAPDCPMGVVVKNSRAMITKGVELRLDTFERVLQQAEESCPPR